MIDIVDNTEHKVACYDDELLMECPLYSYVQVYDAFYGRENLEVCPPTSEQEVNGQYKPCPTSGRCLTGGSKRAQPARPLRVQILCFDMQILQNSRSRSW